MSCHEEMLKMQQQRSKDLEVEKQLQLQEMCLTEKDEVFGGEWVWRSCKRKRNKKGMMRERKKKKKIERGKEGKWAWGEEILKLVTIK